MADFLSGRVSMMFAGAASAQQAPASAPAPADDAVEAVVNRVGLVHEMRGRFVGRDGRDAPCDLAIPAGGADAAIVTMTSHPSARYQKGIHP